MNGPMFLATMVGAAVGMMLASITSSAAKARMLLGARAKDFESIPDGVLAREYFRSFWSMAGLAIVVVIAAYFVGIQYGAKYVIDRTGHEWIGLVLGGALGAFIPFVSTTWRRFVLLRRLKHVTP